MSRLSIFPCAGGTLAPCLSQHDGVAENAATMVTAMLVMTLGFWMYSIAVTLVFACAAW